MFQLGRIVLAGEGARLDIKGVVAIRHRAGATLRLSFFSEVEQERIWVGFENFRTLFGDAVWSKQFWNALGNNAAATTAVITTACKLILLNTVFLQYCGPGSS